MGGIEKKKIWTGFLIAPALLALIAWGPSLTLPLMVLIATFLGLREFYTLALPRSKTIERVIGITSGLILNFLLAFGNLERTPLFLVLILLLLLVLSMGVSETLATTVTRVAVSLFGILYIGFLLSYVSLIRALPDGKVWALFLIVTVWAGDIFAFSSGSLLGRHKLYPKISPKKTYEGLIGGILGSILLATAFALLFLPGVNTRTCALLAVGMGVFGQMGDFSESMLKRSAQVKDSGNLIPGHGGMLDRIDSFLFASPFLYYSLVYHVKGTP